MQHHGFFLSPGNTKYFFFHAYRVAYDAITPGTIQWNMTGIKKYYTIYEEKVEFKSMNLLKITMKGHKRLFGVQKIAKNMYCHFVNYTK